MMADKKVRMMLCGFLIFANVPAAFSQPAGDMSQKVATVSPTPASNAASEKVAVSGKKGTDTISLDFKDAEIGTVLRVLSMKSGVNIVAGPDVKGSVTVRLDDVSWDKALEVILRTYDYVFERDGNIIRVTTREKMKLEPVQTKTFILNYSKAAEIQKAIQDILTERGRIKVAERTNMLVVTDIPTNLYKIGEVISNLDKETSQAYIDSKVVRTQSGAAENLGIQWSPQAALTGASRPTTFPFTSADYGVPSSLKQFFPVTQAAAGANPVDVRAFPNIAANTGTPTPSFSYGTLSFTDFSAILQLLQSYSNTKIVSNPRVVVLNNQTANIQVGSDYPIPNFERNETTGSMEVSGYDYRELGVVLNVTPHINSAKEILVDLQPEVSSFGEMVTFISGTGGLAAPSFNVTKAKTQVLIQSGQTIAIGGLLTDNEDTSEAKVPYLADIPLVGKLFRSKRQTAGDANRKAETLFFVTVTMVDSEGQPVSKKVTSRDQMTGAQDAAQAMDKSVAHLEHASKSEAPKEDGAQSPSKP